MDLKFFLNISYLSARLFVHARQIEMNLSETGY